jgi:hypothetical protein
VIVVDVAVVDVNDWTMIENYRTMYLYRKNANSMRRNVGDGVDGVDDYFDVCALKWTLMMIGSDGHHPHRPFSRRISSHQLSKPRVLPF